MTAEPGLETEADSATTNAVSGASSFVIHPLVAELVQLGNILIERQLWLLLALGLMLWSLAYQVPYTFSVSFGGDRATGRRYDDAQFIRGWNNEPEPADRFWLTTQRNQEPFRWAFNQAQFDLPGIGHGAWQVGFRAAGQPTAQLTPSIWSDGTISSTLALDQQPRLYHHLFHSDSQGNLALRFTTPAYTPAGDPRPLGFVGYYATVRSVGLHLPPLNQFGALAAVSLVIYLLMRRLGAHWRWATLAGIALVLLTSGLLAFWRIALTSFAPALGWLALGCYPLALGLLRLPWGDTATWSRDDEGMLRGAHLNTQHSILNTHNALVGLIVLGFAIRLGGMLHPQLIFSDIGLNAHNLHGLIGGAVYQTEPLPERAGGGLSPYPSGQYIVAAPLVFFAGAAEGEEAVKLQLSQVLKVTNALLDSLVIGLLWLLLTRLGYGQAAALFAAALYVMPGPTFKSFGVGEFANIAGQSLAMPLLIALPLLVTRLREMAVFALLAALLLLALLGHAGVTISLVLLLGCLGLVWLVNPATRRQVPFFLLLGVVVAALVGLFFHSAFLALFVAGERSAPVAQAVPSLGFAAKVWNDMQRAILAAGAPTSPLLVAIGAIGLALVARGPAATRLLPLLLAWIGSAALSIGVLAVRDQTVRWDLFLFPMLCIAAGPLLAALWQRNRVSKAAALLLAATLAAQGLAFWVGLIANQYHV